MVNVWILFLLFFIDNRRGIFKSVTLATYCPTSLRTLKNVPSCPRSKSAWETASANKKCATVVQSCVSQEKFVYHCLINTYINATIEVCAPFTNILGYYCAEYNIEGARIQGHPHASCTACPFRYPSTNAYRYQSCYDLIERNPSTLTIPKIEATTTSVRNTTVTPQQSKSADSVVMIISIALGVVGFILAAIGVLLWVKRISARNGTNRDATSIEMSPLPHEEEVHDRLIDEKSILENQSMPTVLKETGESEARVYRKFTAAIEIGRHYTGYGYSTKDEMGTVVPAGSSDNMKILSAVWYNSRDDETKIGYDAQDEFLKDHENPPEYVSYAADLSFVFDQMETFSPRFAKFVLA
ncbi:uncharacterized protein LOC125668733 [Ostrea edulis]|uniref:uncharacterized protein LOC125668733 n=1 Tax=Ostrea edulis TaxID=37623 RepID=UPI0024AFFDF5|nr:uncharacterized protein LOC125668733 [Ostrea edulis]